MRNLLALLPFVVLGVACAQPATDVNAEPKGSTTSHEAAGGCSLTREQILGSVSAARGAAIQRGFAWFDQGVPYSQSETFEGYRTDCSGFVSMCWELGEPGQTTSTLPDVANALDSYDDLIPGDAIDDPGHHVVMFLGWDDDAHTGACVIEQASTASDMQLRVRSTDSLQSGGFQPFRAPQFASDTTLNTGGSTTPGTTPDPTTPDLTTPSVGTTCVPSDPAMVCFSAHASSGLECGMTVDSCGTAIDCSQVQGFTCKSGGSCLGNRCSGGTASTTCTPKTAAEACIAAKEKSGAECGSVDDGCGKKVSCEGQPEYGCSDGEKCTSKNKCSGSTGEVDGKAGKDHKDPLATGEPGDVKGDKGTSKTKGNSAAWKTNATKQNSGCSAAPGTSNGGELAIVGLAVALVIVRRRRS